MTDMTDIHRRLDDHSKRILRLEESHVHFGRLLEEMRGTLQRVSEFLFGNSNPNEVSIKEQVNNLVKLVTTLVDKFEKSEAASQLIRKDGFARIESLEEWRDEFKGSQKDNRRDWKQFGLDLLKWGLTFALATILADKL